MKCRKCLQNLTSFLVELSDKFVFLRKTESCICLEVTSEIGTEPQLSFMCGVQGMGLISFLQNEDLIIVFQSDGREEEKIVIRNTVTYLYDS